MIITVRRLSCKQWNEALAKRPAGCRHPMPPPTFTTSQLSVRDPSWAHVGSTSGLPPRSRRRRAPPSATCEFAESRHGCMTGGRYRIWQAAWFLAAARPILARLGQSHCALGRCVRTAWRWPGVACHHHRRSRAGHAPRAVARRAGWDPRPGDRVHCLRRFCLIYPSAAAARPPLGKCGPPPMA